MRRPERRMTEVSPPTKKFCADDILLRDVMNEDLPVFFEDQRDSLANRMAAFPPREWNTFVEHWRMNVLGNATSSAKTILVASAIAGYVSSWEQERKRFVAYWIGRDYWGQGVATAALLAFLGRESMRPLYADVAAKNLGSIRVLEKCGFRRFGESTIADDGFEELFFVLEAAPGPSET